MVVWGTELRYGGTRMQGTELRYGATPDSVPSLSSYAVCPIPSPILLRHIPYVPTLCVLSPYAISPPSYPPYLPTLCPTPSPVSLRRMPYVMSGTRIAYATSSPRYPPLRAPYAITIRYHRTLSPYAITSRALAPYKCRTPCP
eukprot:420329-Rhodomonas_salina.1